MRFLTRLKRIEEKLLDDGKTWALFLIGCYLNPIEANQKQQTLITDYILQGNQAPDYCIFINEVPSPGRPCREGFLSLFRTNDS